MTIRTALFPGSFDPVHNGHLEVLMGALRIFDRVVMATFASDKPTAMFSMEDRVAMLEESTAHLPEVQIRSFDTLVVNLAAEVEAVALIRGLRAVSDFESELQMAQMNNHLANIETVFIPTSSASSFLASRLIREASRYGGDVSGLVPEPVARRLAGQFGSGASNT